MNTINRIGTSFIPQEADKKNNAAPGKFSGMLEEKLAISRHAEQRLEKRGITISEDEKTRLGKAADQAKARGAKETLVLVNNKAFLINTSTKTMITAMDRNSMNGNIFTNIDSAVIL
ncbi:MAG: hypothetical protein A2096_03610 [Spirochaetes bacterium GWF1_41_5]|nr:MAG: hypothetical protein A2096_03610 [Spirochaetes bacterium GWF1_41_5]